MRYLLLILLLASCTQGIDERPRELFDKEVEYNEIFSYGEVSSYTYAVHVPGLDEVNSTTQVYLEEFEGGEYFALENTLFVPQEVMSTMLIDKESHACIAIDYGECPAEGLNSEAIATSTFLIAGTSGVFTPLDEFSTKKYGDEEIMFYLSEDIPVPVKIEGPGYEMVLVQYT